MSVTQQFDVQSWQQGRKHRLALVGELDCATEGALVAALEQAESRHPVSLTLDLTQLSFMDSCGVNQFTRAGQRALEGGWAFDVTHVSGQPLKVLTTLSMPADSFAVVALAG